MKPDQSQRHDASPEEVADSVDHNEMVFVPLVIKPEVKPEVKPDPVTPSADELLAQHDKVVAESKPKKRKRRLHIPKVEG